MPWVEVSAGLTAEQAARALKGNSPEQRVIDDDRPGLFLALWHYLADKLGIKWRL